MPFELFKQAVLKNDLPQVEQILAENPELLRNNDNVDSALLHWVVSDQDNQDIKNRKKLVKFLLENYEIDINQTILNGVTALHEAVTCQQTKVVKVLLQYGAKILANNDGYTPLHFATNRNDTNITSLLLDHGADAHAKNNVGDTPAHLAAAENENASTFNLLIKKIPDHHALLLAENSRRETPFDIAMARAEFSIDEKKDLMKIVLLENPMLEMPNAVSGNQHMQNTWHTYKNEIRAIQADKSCQQLHYMIYLGLNQIAYRRM